MSTLCDKLSDHLSENRTGLTAEDGVKLTSGKQAFKDIGDMIKVTDSGSKLLADILEGDGKRRHPKFTIS